MSKTATLRWLVALVLLPVLGAQAQPLDDDFIFFVNGPNVLIPQTDFLVVNDPLNPGDPGKVARFNNSPFTPVRFAGFDRVEGTDATEYTGAEYGDSQYELYVKILSGPANIGQNAFLTFFDSTDDPTATREELEAGAEGDLEFRLNWTIPEEAHSGEWVEYAIPLPPSTIAALDSAKVGKKSDGTPLDVEFDPLAANWSYPGGWSNGGAFGFGAIGGFNPPTDDPLWEEFSWDAVHSMAVFFDFPEGGEPIYLDDIYIAQEPLDLSVAEDPPAPMSGVTFSANGETNLISWMENPEFGGYNVYTSLDEITDPTAEGVLKLGTVPFTAEALEFTHEYELPHPTLGQEPIYYAVTSLSGFGVENFDVSASSGSITNPDLAQQPYIIQLTDDEANTIFGNVANGNVSEDGFPDGFPSFVIDSSHRQLGDSPTPELPEDSDISARARMAYSDFNELYIYAEFTDDFAQFIGADTENPGTETWNYDSFEVGWGNYDVRDIPGGSILVGSPETDFNVGGEFANYQFRMSGLQDATGDVVGSTTFVGPRLGAEIPAGGSVVEKTDTGWRLLTLIPLNAIQVDGDAVLSPPAADEIRYVPMELGINDADGELREHQITWGLKPNHTNQWWNTPAQWPTVAMAGRSTIVPVSNEDAPVHARTFGLDANYPNPFARTTEIGYTLDREADVALEVYDVLGRKVAVLVEQTQAAGTYDVEFDAHGLASGLYIYRLRAGNQTAVRQMMILK